MTRPIHKTRVRVADGKGEMSAQGEPPVKLLVAMTGKASAAKTATGPEPVRAYIANFGRGPKIPVVGEFARRV